MKINKKSILSSVLAVTLVIGVFAGCAKDETKDETEATTKTEQTQNNEKPKSDAPVLGEDVTLNSGEVVKKDNIQKEAEAYIPDSLPKEITNVDDLIKYNDYVETLPDGREKELLLLKMQLFLEQIQ